MCAASVHMRAFTTASPRGKKRELILALCVGSHTNDPCVFPSGKNMVFNALHAARMRGRRGAAVVNAGGGVRHAAPATALSQHRGPTPPQKKKGSVRHTHTSLPSSYTMHSQMRSSMLDEGSRRQPYCVRVFFAASWTCPGFTDVHKFRCFGVSEFLECVRCFGAVFVSLAEFPCDRDCASRVKITLHANCPRECELVRCVKIAARQLLW